MIVCSCNVVSDRQVRDVMSGESCRTPGEVYRCLGCSPQCGRCARTIRNIMDQAIACGGCPESCGHAGAHVGAMVAAE